jgi:hypothetical protein
LGATRSAVARKDKSKAAVPSLAELKRVKELGKKKYKNAQWTDSAYEGYKKHGKDFLAKVVEGRRKAESEEPALEWRKETDKMALAFENPPNKYSAMMLEHWIVHKCFNKGLGQSTVDGIHAAFIRYWDNMCDFSIARPLHHSLPTSRGCSVLVHVCSTW